jgi:hypothetical protein
MAVNKSGLPFTINNQQPLTIAPNGGRNGFRDPTTLHHRPISTPHSRRRLFKTEVCMARGTVVTRTTKSREKCYHAVLWTGKPDGAKKQVRRTFRLNGGAEAYLDTQSKLVRDSEYIEPSTMTFAVFATEWLEKYLKLAQLKDSTWATYHNTVHRRFPSVWKPASESRQSCRD